MNKQIELYRTTSPTVVDAFDNIVANVCLQREKNGYKSFLLTGCEPGVGSTTIAIELAIALANTGWKTLLLDADMRKNAAYKHLNESVLAGLTDYIQGTVDDSRIIYPTTVELLDYIPCGNVGSGSPLRMLYSHKMTKLLNILNGTYEFVIIDAPSVISSVDPHILSVKSDATILVAALDGSNRKYLEDARERLIQDGANIIGVIQNKVSIDEYKDYIKDYDYFSSKKYLHGNHLSFERNYNNTNGRFD